MSNQHNLVCPECGSPDEIYITVTMHIEGMLVEDGADYDAGGDFEWEESDPARCGECGWNGTVAGLIVLEPEDEVHYEDDSFWALWRRRGDDAPCPQCGAHELESRDGITLCHACGWQADNPVMLDTYAIEEEGDE